MNELELPIKTLVSSIRPESESLRTVIPQSIAQMLKVQSGDTLLWDFQIVEKEVIVTVKKGSRK